MIIEIGGGNGGFKEYLETGRKKNRDLHRDTLDQRISLVGDLDVFEFATSIHEGTGRRYDHVTLSFTENNVSDNMLKIAADEFLDHALAAWPDAERHRVAFYAEAHRPRILSYPSAETGKPADRYIHIHIGIGRHDLLTGEAIEPLGFLGEQTDNLKFVDAFQESFNARHGFSSPKDNPKITPENAVDTLARYSGARPDSLGTFNERKAALEILLQKKIIEKNIMSMADFKVLLAEHGAVDEMRRGKFNQCFRLKPHGSEKAMRLEGVFFTEQFIERPTKEKIAIISSKARVAYLEQMQPRKEPAYVAGVLDEWRQSKARELRFLHTGSPFFTNEYLPASPEMRLQILNDLERKHHALTSSLPNNGAIKITRARSGLPRLPVRNLDGIQRRSEMLLRSNSGMDVGAVPGSQQGGVGLRQADGGGKSTGLELQPSSVIARFQNELRERFEQAEDKEKFAEIRKNLDCNQLISNLSHSHGLNPDIYQVGAAKDGTPRIKCGSRSLTPSDFLTRELGLAWKDAAPILRKTYEQQLGNKVTKPRSKDAVPSALWKEFMRHRKIAEAELSQRLHIFNAAAKVRRGGLVDRLKADQKMALAGLSGVARKIEQSNQKFSITLAKAEFDALLKDERQALRDNILSSQGVAWQIFLQTRAQAGNEEALFTLRKLDDSARSIKDEAATIGTLTLEDNEKERKRRRAARNQKTVDILRQLVDTVDKAGDRTYSLRGRAVLRDEGRKVAILDENSEEAIIAGLLLAREKFGMNLSLTGSFAFQQRVVEVAVANGIGVKFVDPKLAAHQVILKDVARLPKPRSPLLPSVESPVPTRREAPLAAQPAHDPFDRIPDLPISEPQITVESWIAEHPEMKENIMLLSVEGRILAVFDDGRFIQSLGPNSYAVREPVDFGLAVGQLIKIDRYGKTTLGKPTEKGGRAG